MRLVDQRGVGTPAEGVTMVNLRLEDETAILLQHFFDFRVGVFAVLASEVLHRG